MELLSVTMSDGVIPRSEIEDKDNSSQDKSNYKIVHKGDMVYNSMRMWQGANGISPYDGIVSPAYTVLMPKQRINNGYFAALFKNINMINEFRKNSQGMTSDTWNLNYPQIKTIKIRIPSIYEQEKISEMLGILEMRIASQVQLIDNLKKYKRGALSALFPKKGEITPQYRFAGFTEPWKQRKAKDLCSISTGKSNTQDRVNDGIYPFYVRSPIVEHSNRYLFDEEAVLTVGDGVGTGKVFHYVNGKYDLHQRVYRMFDFSEEITAKYFYYYFSNHFYERVMAMTAKTSVDSVRYEMIADMDIVLPKVKEQMAISACFDRLDNLITLHQHKYDTLLFLKNAILQQMFI